MFLQENEAVRATGHSSQQEEKEQSELSSSLQQREEGETETADTPEWEAEKTAEPRNEVSVAASQPDHFGHQVDFLRLCQCVEDKFCIYI